MPTMLRGDARCATMRHDFAAFAALCLALSIGTADAQTADSGWILKALARPAPMRTDFVEVRESPLLKAPLRLSGEYRRPREDTLVREVRAPYRETTTIVSSTSGAGEATIARAGKPPRTFSLSRAPELASLQNSFGALLAGDRVQIERTYRVTAQGDRARWTLTFVPKDKALAARVRDIALYGQGAELRCIETRPVKGEVQRTLLASAALAVRAATDARGFEQLCRNGVK
jgi:Outer membrane lipoprotein carrier protein LolA-like